MKEVKLYLKRTISIADYENVSVDFGGIQDSKPGETIEETAKRMFEEIEPVFDNLCQKMELKHSVFKKPEIPKKFTFGVPQKKD